MSNKSIDDFAESLVRLVRDRAVQNCHTRLDPETRSPVGKRWLEIVRQARLSEVADVIINDTIDETIFCLLSAIDEEGLRLSFTTPSGRNVDLSEEGMGELAGWYMGAGNWREQFSKERVSDYLS